MSFFKSIGNSIIDLFAPIVQMVVRRALVDVAFPALKAKDPIAYKTALVSMYAPLDVYLEKIVQGTDTDIDDAVVNGILEAIEDAAAADGIDLPNVDDDSQQLKMEF